MLPAYRLFRKDPSLYLHFMIHLIISWLCLMGQLAPRALRVKHPTRGGNNNFLIEIQAKGSLLISFTKRGWIMTDCSRGSLSSSSIRVNSEQCRHGKIHHWFHIYFLHIWNLQRKIKPTNLLVTQIFVYTINIIFNIRFCQTPSLRPKTRSWLYFHLG